MSDSFNTIVHRGYVLMRNWSIRLHETRFLGGNRIGRLVLHARRHLLSLAGCHCQIPFQILAAVVQAEPGREVSREAQARGGRPSRDPDKGVLGDQPGQQQQPIGEQQPVHGLVIRLLRQQRGLPLLSAASAIDRRLSPLGNRHGKTSVSADTRPSTSGVTEALPSVRGMKTSSRRSQRFPTGK